MDKSENRVRIDNGFEMGFAYMGKTPPILPGHRKRQEDVDDLFAASDSLVRISLQTFSAVERGHVANANEGHMRWMGAFLSLYGVAPPTDGYVRTGLFRSQFIGMSSSPGRDEKGEKPAFVKSWLTFADLEDRELPTERRSLESGTPTGVALNGLANRESSPAVAYVTDDIAATGKVAKTVRLEVA